MLLISAYVQFTQGIIFTQQTNNQRNVHIVPVRIDAIVNNLVGGKINIILFYFSIIPYKLRKGRKLYKGT